MLHLFSFTLSVKYGASTNEPNLNGFSIIEIFRNETFRKDTKNKDAQMINSLKLLLFNIFILMKDCPWINNLSWAEKRLSVICVEEKSFLSVYSFIYSGISLIYLRISLYTKWLNVCRIWNNFLLIRWKMFPLQP